MPVAPPNARLAWLFHNKLILMAHGADAPTDSEWTAFLAAMRKERAAGRALCTLVFTGGGAPNLGQREGLRTVLGGKECPTAVVSDSTIARAVMSIIRLRNPSIAAFDPSEVNNAFEFLRLEEDERAWVNKVVADLRKAVQ